MIRASALSEWTKLKRRSNFWLLLIAGSLTILSTFISFTGPTETGLNGGPAPVGVSMASLQSSDGIVAGVAQSSDFLGLLALGLFAFAFASEFSQGTIRNLLVRAPGRMRLMFGKWLALCVFAVMLGLLTTMLSAAVALAVAPGQGLDTSAWELASVLERVLTCSLAFIGYGTMGAVLGLLLRSPVAAIGAGALYLLPFEAIMGAAWNGTDRWFPGELLGAVLEGGNTAIELVPALLRVGFTLGALSILALLLFRSRDVLE